MTREERRAIIAHANERQDTVNDLNDAVRGTLADIQIMNKLLEQMRLAYESYANHATAVTMTLNRLMGEVNKEIEYRHDN